MAAKQKGSTKSPVARQKRNDVGKINKPELPLRASPTIAPHHLGHLESERLSNLRRRQTRF
jgi:hypothetical protein